MNPKLGFRYVKLRELVQVMTKTKNVYLAIMVDLQLDLIHGHHLLDLNEKYGVTGGKG